MSEEQDWYYVVKVKTVDEDPNSFDEYYSEIEYRTAQTPADLPGPDDDFSFLGFVGGHEPKGDCKSYVCSEIMVIEEGTRKEKEFKKNLNKEPWERMAGGV